MKDKKIGKRFWTRQREIDEAEKFWSTVDSVLIRNDKFDDGSLAKEWNAFHKKFFSKDFDEYEDTPLGQLVENMGKTWTEYISEEIQYMQAKGVYLVQHKANKDEHN